MKDNGEVKKLSLNHVAIVVCGDDESRVEETIICIKSAVLFSHQFIKFHIFTEDILKTRIISRYYHATVMNSCK